MSEIIIIAGALAYPVIAGMVYRRMDAPDDWCERSYSRAYPSLTCSRAKRRGAYRSLSSTCASCGQREQALVTAWLWPLALVWYLPARLFRAGANVNCLPTTTETE